MINLQKQSKEVSNYSHYLIPGAFVLLGLSSNTSLRFLVLATLIWLMLKSSQVCKQLCVSLLLLATYCFAFIINPICILDPIQHLLSPSVLKVMSPPITRSISLIAICILFGFTWLAIALPTQLQFKRSTSTSIPFYKLMVTIIAFVIFFYNMWNADVEYTGDEIYHVLSIQGSEVAFFHILSQNWPFKVAALLFAGVCILLFYVLRCQSLTKKRICLYTTFASGLLLSAFFLYYFPESLLSDAFFKTRILRYPAAEPWISTLISICNYQFWVKHIPIPLEDMRLLPLLSLIGIALYLLMDRRWKTIFWPISIISTMAIITIPNLYYHGAILYLELPALLLLIIIINDSKKLLSLPFSDVKTRWSWIAAIMLGFTKETLFPSLFIFFVLRLFIRMKKSYFRKKWNAKKVMIFILNEAGFMFCFLGPILFYIFLRKLYPSREYAANFSHLFNLSLYLKMTHSILSQTGVLLIFSFIGIIVLLKKRCFISLLCAMSVFAINVAFFLCDERVYIGLARFNLVLLPSLIFFAWEGLTFLICHKNMKKIAVGMIILILLFNIYNKQCDSLGRRTKWRWAGQTWYPYMKCLYWLKTNRPVSNKIIFANMKLVYGVAFLSTQVNFPLEYKQLYFKTKNVNYELANSARYAIKNGYDYIILRRENKKMKIQYDKQAMEFLKNFDAAEGALSIFKIKKTVARAIKNPVFRK